MEYDNREEYIVLNLYILYFSARNLFFTEFYLPHPSFLSNSSTGKIVYVYNFPMHPIIL